jgi:hypothetical protein
VMTACTVVWLWQLRPRLGPYYATRFGRVGSPVHRYWPLYSMLLVQGTGWMNAFGSMPLDGPMWVIAPLVLWPAIPLAAYAGWIARRDFPTRVHWAVIAIVIIVLALDYPIGDVDSAHSLWRANSLLYGGAAIALAGLRDHLILARVLRGQRQHQAVATEGPTQ